MKKIILSFLLSAIWVLGFTQTFQVNVSGTVTDQQGNPVADKLVDVQSDDSITGFYYFNSVFTDSAGFYQDSFDVPNNLTQGAVMARTLCYGDVYVFETGFFWPSNTNVVIDLQLCSDSTGGGGSGCEASFWYSYPDSSLLTIQFTDVSEGNPNSWYWDFGDGTYSTEQNPLHTYAEPDIYEVTLSIIAGDSSCASSVTQEVRAGNPSGGGDCYALFDANPLDGDSIIMTYQFTDLSTGSNGFPVETWYWDFGDGTYSTQQNPVHTFEDEGEYEVCLTITSDSMTCESIYCNSVFAGNHGGGNQGFSLYGVIYLDDSNSVASSAMICLLALDTIDNSLFLLSTSHTTDGGHYGIGAQNADNCVYYILAELDSADSEFGNYIPTYHLDAVNWEDATAILPDNLTGNRGVDVYMQPVAPLSPGEGIISGIVTGDINREDLANVEVLLLNGQNQPLTYVRTDENGAFAFNNIDYGTYVVYTEIAGIQTIPGSVVLDENNKEVSVVVTVAGGEAVLGLPQHRAFIKEAGNVYPNPVGPEARLTLNLVQASGVTVSIVDQVGKTVRSNFLLLRAGQNTVRLQTGDLPVGIYFVKIQSMDKMLIVKKFVKTN